MTVPLTPAREAPFPFPSHCGLTDPSHPDAPDEPALAIDDIQGSILAGFNKPFQTLLLLTIDDPAAFKTWLSSLIPFIASLGEVEAFNRLFKAVRDRRGESRTVKATWVNIAFAAPGLRALGIDVATFTDEAFREGLAARSLAGLLGDPIDDPVPGNPENWVVGGPGNEADVILIVAADDQDDLIDQANDLTTSLRGASVLRREDGAELPGDLTGHEHFGFLDGVSQPGVRGRLSDDPHDVLTLRQNPNNRNQGKPGQDLLWPGEFVVGYPSQQPNPLGEEDIDVGDPGPVSSAGPDWARNGSLLVFRRLQQNVFALHTFLHDQAAALGIPAPPVGTAEAFVGSKMVGRWPTGAPVMRTPDEDNPDLAMDDCANNNFEFQEETPPIPATGFSGPFDCRDDEFEPSEGDKEGIRCPFSGHIRKVYPRDDESEAGQPVPNETDTQTHRLIRRGIPFGDPSPSTPDHPVDDGIVDRGLLFLAYQTSIEEQFEFVIGKWVNNPDFKDPDTGHDPIIGQNNVEGQHRERFFFIPGPGREPGRRVTTRVDWVVPTGGGYFFAPSIEALNMLAS